MYIIFSLTSLDISLYLYSVIFFQLFESIDFQFIHFIIVVTSLVILNLPGRDSLVLAERYFCSDKLHSFNTVVTKTFFGLLPHVTSLVPSPKKSFFAKLILKLPMAYFSLSPLILDILQNLQWKVAPSTYGKHCFNSQ